MPLTPIDHAAMSALFLDARSTQPFTDEPVTDDDLRAIWDIARLPPTSSNINPVRVVFVQSADARARLVANLAEGNRAKTEVAPAVALLAWDSAFYEEMGQLFPARPEMGAAFADDPNSDTTAQFNASLQCGYFLLAIRAVGLAAGPMTGFDFPAMDAEFFPDGRLSSLMVVNMGYPAGPSPFPRLPRLGFDDAAQIL